MLQVTSLPIKTGFVTFKPQQDQNIILKLVDQKPLSLLIQDEDWDLSVRRYRQMINNGTLKLIEVLQIKALKIRWGNQMNVIQEIKEISFPSLKELYLRNSIVSIQNLISLNLESLNILNLKQNNLSNLKSLRKCKLTNLKDLTLYNNRILDFRSLQELHAPLLQKIWTTPQEESFDTHQASSWIFRLQSNQLKELYIKHQRGHNFDFENIQQMIGRRYCKEIKLIYSIRDDINSRLE